MPLIASPRFHSRSTSTLRASSSASCGCRASRTERRERDARPADRGRRGRRGPDGARDRRRPRRRARGPGRGAQPAARAQARGRERPRDRHPVPLDRRLAGLHAALALGREPEPLVPGLAGGHDRRAARRLRHARADRARGHRRRHPQRRSQRPLPSRGRRCTWSAMPAQRRWTIEGMLAWTPTGASSTSTSRAGACSLARPSTGQDRRLDRARRRRSCDGGDPPARTQRPRERAAAPSESSRASRSRAGRTRGSSWRPKWPTTCSRPSRDSSRPSSISAHRVQAHTWSAGCTSSSGPPAPQPVLAETSGTVCVVRAIATTQQGDNVVVVAREGDPPAGLD